MEVIFKNYGSLPHHEQLAHAVLISDYTNAKLGESPQMLPVTPDEVLKKFAGVVALCDKNFAGYVGSTAPIVNNGAYMSEVGSLWVPQTYRRQGIAGRLVHAISDDLVNAGLQPYAFCNPLSLTVFTAQGYQIAQANEVPVCAFEACASCPKKPLDGCCDTPVVLKGDA